MFASAKLTKTMNDDTKLVRAYGTDIAGQVRKRLDDLSAAATLEDMKTLPGRCEELSGERKGQLSVRLGANYRLIFEPYHDPIPTKLDGGLDWTHLTTIRVIEVIDYH